MVQPSEGGRMQCNDARQMLSSGLSFQSSSQTANCPATEPGSYLSGAATPTSTDDAVLNVQFQTDRTASSAKRVNHHDQDAQTCSCAAVALLDSIRGASGNLPRIQSHQRPIWAFVSRRRPNSRRHQLQSLQQRYYQLAPNRGIPDR